MDNKNEIVSKPAQKKPRFSFLRIIGMVALAIILIAFLSGWWVKHYLYASQFTPTVLNAKEQKALDSKLARLEEFPKKDLGLPKKKSPEKEEILEPEAYSEEGAKREIHLTERELNALIAHHPEMARRVAIHLSEDLISVKLVVPIDEEIPVLGGKTLRLHLGLILNYEKEKPVVALKGVSLGGIPVPNAWLGNLKNKNLVKEFGDQGGFWKFLSEGVAEMKVKKGHLLIRLKE